MTIKLELPEDNHIVLQEMGLALTRIAEAMNGGKRKQVETIPVIKLPDEDVEKLNKARVEAGYTELTSDNRTEEIEQPPVVEAFTESGPFYWFDKASGTCGEVATLGHLTSVTGDRCTYDEYLKYNEDFNGTETAASTFAGNADNLGKDGIPWDKRIHSQGRTQSKASGNFNLRKKPAAYETKEQWVAYVEEVKQELRGVMSAPVVETVVPPVVETVVPPVVETVVPPVVETPAIVVPPVVETPAIVVPPVVENDVTTFQQLMLLITKNNKAINKDQVLEILNRHGVTAVPLLATRTDLIPQIANDIKAHING